MTEVFSVSCFLIVTLSFRASLYCSAPCPILSSSHCVCVKKLVSPLGQGAGMPGWSAPGESAFWTSLVPLVWCSASICCWVSLSGTPGGPLLQTPPTTVFEPPALLKIPSSSECCYPVLLGRATVALNAPKYLLFLSRTTVMRSYSQPYQSGLIEKENYWWFGDSFHWFSPRFCPVTEQE